MTHEQQTSTLQHTPAPWSISGVGPKSRTIYRATSGSVYPVCDVTADNLNRYGAGDLDANARLIATAPELLEALKYVIEASMGGEKWSLDILQNAINKAEGRYE